MNNRKQQNVDFCFLKQRKHGIFEYIRNSRNFEFFSGRVFERNKGNFDQFFDLIMYNKSKHEFGSKINTICLIQKKIFFWNTAFSKICPDFKTIYLTEDISKFHVWYVKIFQIVFRTNCIDEFSIFDLVSEIWIF
jgi:hypothetical protein